MHLAINYSPAAARLVRSGIIDIDYFKVPDWDWMIAEAQQLRPVAVHFTLDAGNDGLGHVDWDKIRALAQLTGTRYINLHLDARQDSYPDLPLDTTNATDIKRVFDTIYADVMAVAQRFGSERVIIENSPYQAMDGQTLLLCAQPDLIAQVISETGCGLLLDISHAIITALHLGMDPEDYISQLPMQALKELHFAGIHPDLVNGGLMDHLSIQTEDWHRLDWTINCIQTGGWNTPWMLAFEYGGVGEPFEWRTDPEVIAAQVPELYKHIRALSE